MTQAVAICGPKSSRITAEAIDTDPVLSLEPDASGRWTIRDRLTGQTYESPLDAQSGSRSEDVGYLARLTHNSRSMLFIAGVHSLGSVGIVHYLAHNLHDLYEVVGLRNFSMVVGSTHDGDNVTGSTAVCPPRLH